MPIRGPVDKEVTDSIVIGYPHNGYVTAIFMGAMMRAFAQDKKGILAGWIQYGGCNIVSNRNRIVSDFLTKTEASHLLFIDTDQDFPPEAPRVLLEASKDVSGVLAGAVPLSDGSSSFYELTGPGAYKSVPPVDGIIQELDAAGTGLMLIPRRVLEGMKEQMPGLHDTPWFGQEYEGETLLGTDLSFCARVRFCGYTIHGHGGVRAKHLKHKLLELP